MDKSAKTILVGKRTFQISAESLITKGDQPATLEDGVVGESVSGSYLKGEDGKLNVVKLHFGPKSGVAPKSTKTGMKKEQLKRD